MLCVNYSCLQHLMLYKEKRKTFVIKFDVYSAKLIGNILQATCAKY